MTRHIGIVACSAEGAALCYRTLCIEAPLRLGGYDHPEITMHGLSFDQYMAAINAGDWRSVADLMLISARVLAGAGADFAICPDNTIHQALPRVEAASPIPWLHMPDEVARTAQEMCSQRPAVLGTRWLMEGPVYDGAFRRLGMEQAIPGPEERETVNRIIFDELVRGERRADSLDRLVAIIRNMQSRGCDSVVLGCTELPLLITPENSPLPVLDSTRVLARAALREAIDGSALAAPS